MVSTTLDDLDAAQPQSAPAAPQRSLLALPIALASVLALIALVVALPFSVTPVVVAIAVAGWLAWRPFDFPLPCIAVLPVVDWVAPSGVALFDGVDLVILGTVAGLATAMLAGALPRPAGRSALRQKRTALVFVVAAFLIVSVFKALLPTQPFEPSALLTPVHTLNALHAGKFVVLLMLLAVPARAVLLARPDTCIEQLTRGLNVSLVLIGLVVLEQRGLLRLMFDGAGLAAIADATLTTRPQVPGPFAEARFGAWPAATWAFLALPLALLGALRERVGARDDERWGTADWLLSLAGLAFGVYTAFNTMQGPALLLLGVVALVMLPMNLARAFGDKRLPLGSTALFVVAAVVASAALLWAFEAGGYRALFVGMTASVVGALLGRARGRWSMVAGVVVAALLAAGVAALWSSLFATARWSDDAVPALAVVVAVAGVLLGASLVAGIAARQLLNLRAAVVMVLSIAMLWALLVPSLVGERLQNSAREWRADVSARITDVRAALRLPGDGLLDRLIGEGLGSYPDIKFWRDLGSVDSSSVRIVGEGEPPYVSLGVGQHAIAQRVRVAAGESLSLRARLRAPEGGVATLRVRLCPASVGAVPVAECQAQEASAGADGWASVELGFDGVDTSLVGGALLLLSNASEASLIDVTDLSLRGGAEADKLRNGDFAAGAAPWVLVARSTPTAWSPRNLYAQLWVEQGAIGLVLFFVLVGVAVLRQLKQVGEGATIGAALVPALLGALALGVFVTIIDVPRSAWLLYLLILTALYVPSVRDSGATAHD